MIVLTEQRCACSSLRRSQHFDLVYSSKMGAQESPECVVGGDYYAEEEVGQSDKCSNPSSWHIGIKCCCTWTTIPIVG